MKIEETTKELNRALQAINPKWRVEIKEYVDTDSKKISVRVFESGRFIYAKAYYVAQVNEHIIRNNFLSWVAENHKAYEQEKIPTELGAPGEDKYGIPPNARNRGDRGWASIDEHIENAKK